MSTTLVTGAAGLIGSHVARALVARGDRVRVTVPAHASLDALAGLDVEADTDQLAASVREEILRRYSSLKVRAAPTHHAAHSHRGPVS